MIDAPNSDDPSAFADAMLRLQRSTAQTPEAKCWQWMLFDDDFKTGIKAGRGAAGPVISLGLPWLSRECSLRWVGPRYFFWPQGIPRQRRVSIVSSQLKRRLDEESWWFDLLRTATLRNDPTFDVLCAVSGTAPHRYVCRAAALFGRPVLEFHVNPKRRSVDHTDIASWITDIASQAAWDSEVAVTESDLIAEPQVVEKYTTGALWSVFVSPLLSINNRTTCGEEMTAGNILSGLPIADRILFAAGECLQALQVRSGGSIQALLTQHIQDNERNHSLVMLVSDAAGQIPTIGPDSASCLIPWLLKSNHDMNQIGQENSALPESELTATESAPVSTPLLHPADWLLHWTRSTVGPWPDQDTQEFNDELILGCRSADRSALATLLRIVTECRLWASSETIRGSFPVVSFTEVPLHEFRDRRTYRRHRRRYDFEPWGIAVRRDVLATAGARPVQYGNNETWRAMPQTDRPFFQNVGTDDGWTKEEREWRIIGHLPLSELPSSAVIVFVDTEAARKIVQSQTAWPVIVVPE